MNMPSVTFSTFALCTMVTRFLRRCANSNAARAMRSQQSRVIRRSEIATSFVTSISPVPVLHIAVGVEAFRVLARDDQIEVAAAGVQTGIGPRGPDVGEEVERLAQPHRRIDLATMRILELIRVRWAEHDAIGAERLLDDVGVNRVIARLQARIADRRVLELQSEPEPRVGRFQDIRGRGGDFRADPIAGENQKVHACAFRVWDRIGAGNLAGARATIHPSFGRVPQSLVVQMQLPEVLPERCASLRTTGEAAATPHTTMTPVSDTSVLIVGGGPVGMTLAIDLAWRGIDVTVAEMRHAGEPPSPKCNQVSARSMEIYRRLGLARNVRDAGLPPDYPNDVVSCTSVTGYELSRLNIPCRAERFSDKNAVDASWPTPEPSHRINQTYLEPVLFAHAAAQPRIRIINRTQVEGFSQTEDGVIATARDLDTGEPLQIGAQYLVGCDGAKSMVRKAIGANLSGTPEIQRVQSTFIKAPGLIDRLPGKRAWMFFALNPRRCGTVIAETVGKPGSFTTSSIAASWRSTRSIGIGRSVPFSASMRTSIMT